MAIVVITVLPYGPPALFIAYIDIAWCHYILMACSSSSALELIWLYLIFILCCNVTNTHARTLNLTWLIAELGCEKDSFHVSGINSEGDKYVINTFSEHISQTFRSSRELSKTFANDARWATFSKFHTSNPFLKPFTCTHNFIMVVVNFIYSPYFVHLHIVWRVDSFS